MFKDTMHPCDMPSAVLEALDNGYCLEDRAHHLLPACRGAVTGAVRTLQRSPLDI